MYTAWKVNALRIKESPTGPMETIQGFAFAGSSGMPAMVSLASARNVYEAEVELEFVANQFYPYFEFRGCSYEGTYVACVYYHGIYTIQNQLNLKWLFSSFPYLYSVKWGSIQRGS